MSWKISIVLIALLESGCRSSSSTDPSLLFQWNTVDYEWQDEATKDEYLSTEKYIPKNNAINGIRVYKDRVYVTVPRFFPGVPSTLNVLLDKIGEESPLLRPYPNWAMQTEGNCTALQIVQSMEIDPNTGYMWILDTGYKPHFNVSVRPLDACAAKLVIYDINQEREIYRYEFPAEVVGSGLYYLNDIVLDYYKDSASFAYISETLGHKLIVYDHARKQSRAFKHLSMRPEPEAINITIANLTMTVPTGINGIAISNDFKYVYYSAVGGVSLHQIPTDILRNNESNQTMFSAAVRKVGEKVSQGDAMVYSKGDNLYFSTLGLNAVYKWEVSKDAERMEAGHDTIMMETQTVVAEDTRMEWVDTLALDDKGFIWFTTNKMHKFISGESDLNFPNYFIWRIYVNDYAYLNFVQDGFGAFAPCHGVIIFSVAVSWMLMGIAKIR